MSKQLPLPVRLGRYKSKVYSKYFVKVSQSGLHRELWQHKAIIPIIAASPAEAVNAIRDDLISEVEHPTEFECAGPKGGITHRFVGWESLFGAKLCGYYSNAVQLELFSSTRSCHQSETPTSTGSESNTQ